MVLPSKAGAFPTCLLLAGLLAATVAASPGAPATCSADGGDCEMEETALLNVQKRSRCSNPFVVQPGGTCDSLFVACPYGHITCGAHPDSIVCARGMNPLFPFFIDNDLQAGWTCTFETP
ncbi:unnamed protein product [Prorocentrum cordatum]|uniref:Uncharacterized protein n=1 Tax=Prorocentrum cordatum TaxID=2364126 RepID=A0ABN9UZI7_9DINO|nr:unnamed protein product [Polarella glacialis]